MTVGLYMAYNYADARFDDLDLDTRSQWISREKQYLSCGIQRAHDGKLVHDMYNAHVRFGALDLIVFDFENVCKARPSCFFSFPFHLKPPSSLLLFS